LAKEPERAFDAWASTRFEGPPFPDGRAGERNALCVERVVLGKAEANEGW